MFTKEVPTTVRVRLLTKHYRQIVAVDSVSFALQKGEIFGLIGANGAGKTTTIAMILGLVSPTQGQIELFGQPQKPHLGRALGRMNFSSPYVDLPHRLTVTQNLRVYADLYNVPRAARRIRSLLAQLDLVKLAGTRYGRLSSGQKTRVSLAKALLNEPELLLLDEPTASLDPDVADRIRGQLLSYREKTGATILVTSHNMLEVERICHRVAILKRGQIVAEGTPDNVTNEFGRETLEQVFLDIARGSEAPP